MCHQTVEPSRLPNLDDPTRLRFSVAVSWLDNVERELTAAQLIVNGDDSHTIRHSTQ